MAYVTFIPPFVLVFLCHCHCFIFAATLFHFMFTVRVCSTSSRSLARRCSPLGHQLLPQSCRIVSHMPLIKKKNKDKKKNSPQLTFFKDPLLRALSLHNLLQFRQIRIQLLHLLLVELNRLRGCLPSVKKEIISH